MALSVEGVEPLVLLRGLEPRDGIQATVPERGGPFLLGELLPLGDYTLGTYGTVRPSDRYNAVHTDVSMALTWEGGTQTLFTLPGLDEAHPRLVFAGDLDGDGEVDLILDETWHYNLGQLSLWLSSAAEPGQRLGRVAMQESTGC